MSGSSSSVDFNSVAGLYERVSEPMTCNMATSVLDLLALNMASG